MADNNTASAKTDSTKSDAAKTENLLETRSKEKETLPPSPLHTDHGSTLIAEQVV
ncbi:Asp23/Gls24 family envelope stress response protein, partial [Clostridioides difficile]|nr:Asp23/Gls24 family envelope stress response protein [Clostridioides difficile]